MDFFYIDTTEFLKHIDYQKVEKYSDNSKITNHKGKLQHAFGRFIVKFVVENYYHLENSELEIVNNKPKLKFNKNYHFSISHSNNIVGVIFDNSPIGLDIEKIKQRDFQKILKRFNINEINPTKEFFYKFWTEYEAKFKLQSTPKEILTFEYPKEFMTSIASLKKELSKEKLNIYELKNSTDTIENTRFLRKTIVVSYLH